MSENKANAFAAVPHVLQHGKIIDVSKESKPNEKRYLFVAPITLKGKDYYCEVVVRAKNTGRQGFYIHEVELKEKLADVFTASQQGTPTSSKSIIADLVNNFNPSIKNNEEYHQDEPEQQSIFEGNNNARGFRKYKGAYMPAENIIEFFKGADESTIVHEFAHWYLNALVEDAKYHEGSKLDLDAVRKFVRNNGEPFTREQHEKFARGFEAYVRSGWAKTNRLKKR